MASQDIGIRGNGERTIAPCHKIGKYWQIKETDHEHMQLYKIFNSPYKIYIPGCLSKDTRQELNIRIQVSKRLKVSTNVCQVLF